jgi:hypothetical protein
MESKSIQKTRTINNEKYRIIDLKTQSFLEEISEYSKKFRVTLL